METELVKPVVRVGNSAGIVLPKEWLGGEVKVELVRKPLNIKKDVLEILDKYLDKVLGVYLVGSYARGEEDSKSDVDVLVVTSDIDKRIVKGKYEIVLISLEKIKNGIKNVLPIVPMLREARVLINGRLLDELRDYKIDKKSLKWHIDTTESMLSIIEKDLEIEEELGEKMIKGGLAYPLVLRLRQVYIVNCLLKNKKYFGRDFIKFLKKENIHELYEIYRDEKAGKSKKKFDIQVARRACELLRKNFEKQVRSLK